MLTSAYISIITSVADNIKSTKYINRIQYYTEIFIPLSLIFRKTGIKNQKTGNIKTEKSKSFRRIKKQKILVL